MEQLLLLHAQLFNLIIMIIIMAGMMMIIKIVDCDDDDHGDDAECVDIDDKIITLVFI